MYIKPKYVADPNDVPDITDERDAAGGVQITYCGWCRNGATATDTDCWKIVMYKAVSTNGATVTERLFPDGSIMYDKVWDERENYNYIFHR